MGPLGVCGSGPAFPCVLFGGCAARRERRAGWGPAGKQLLWLDGDPRLLSQPSSRLRSPGRGPAGRCRFSPGEGEERRWGRGQPFVCAEAAAGASALPSAGRGGAGLREWPGALPREINLAVKQPGDPAGYRQEIMFLAAVALLGLEAPPGALKNGSGTGNIHKFGGFRRPGEVEVPVKNYLILRGFCEDFAPC